ncbi:DUF397 domain-containing protein [Streptomyces beihaiensis]|uniref:DUF397 domain-containing protein n=1 Tax=Streptomyces beihaiensis TaxID=2984495 RepID=A0ABT3TUT9_9ACTN|nr:DUF397 domain-containing protein [Streptomyces beihaiensis]MCX3060798.1 DUF397 domain-containing protein [Streptomyces beihaiensis]
MRSIDLTHVTWRKSSYSNTTGGDCVEVSDAFLANATWRASSYSNSDGGNCVEVSDDFPAVVPVRDSKNAHGPALVFEAAAWSSFVDSVKAGGEPTA